MLERIKHEPSMGDLWYIFNSYKDLANFYEQHIDLPSEKEIKDRINYLLRNKVKQRTELETLYWLIGKEMPNEENKH